MREILVIPGGGLVQWSYSLGALSQLSEKQGFEIDIAMGNSGGAGCIYSLARQSIVESLELVTSFEKTDDAYKRNSLFRLFGVFFIKNGWYNYDKFRAKMQEIESKPTKFETWCEVIDTKRSILPISVKNPKCSDTISSMSILAMVDLENSCVDPGLVNVVPLNAMAKVVRPGDRITLIDATHRQPEPFDASKNKWHENAMVLPKITAWNTYMNDLYELRKWCFDSDVKLRIIESKSNHDVYDFSSKTVYEAFKAGREETSEKISTGELS